MHNIRTFKYLNYYNFLSCIHFPVQVYLSSLKETKVLLIAANHFGIEEIVQDCFLFLLHQMNLSNCLDIWDFAR